MLSESTIEHLWGMALWLRKNWRGALACSAVWFMAGLVLATAMKGAG